jgi:hypothetical protein
MAYLGGFPTQIVKISCDGVYGYKGHETVVQINRDSVLEA